MTEINDIILNHSQIKHKITRLAWQVYENNMDEQYLWIAGIDRRGMYLAECIADELKRISSQQIYIMNIAQGNDDHLPPEFITEDSIDTLEDSVLILVDDVLNTGKTIMNAMVPLFEKKIRRMQILVLASRSHRMYPLKPDYVGISMATTLKEHLHFDNSDQNNLQLQLN